jgi:outer membrane protein OmpA-like peptidoglycan-associated protein
MNQRTAIALVLSAFPLLALSDEACAQEELPAPTADDRERSSDTVNAGEIRKTEENSKTETQARDIVSGTGILFIVPHLDGGYMSTKPASNNVFSRLETASSGWVVEPKLGLGVFSKKIGLDLLVGIQSHSLNGNIIGTTDDYETNNAPVTELKQKDAYTSTQVVPLVEGNARIRFSNGQFQAGVSATALFGAKNALYSSLVNQGLKYGVLVGPQLIYENRVQRHYFRIAGAAQFLTTGNQRTASVFKFGAAYSYLLNSPYLKVTEKKTVESRARVQKRVVVTRGQNLVQNENVSFIFDSQMINFKFNSADLTEKSNQFVVGLAQIFAAQHSDWKKLVVEGHTDSKGNDDYNKKLSQRRANSVRNVLVQNGVPAEDVRAIGFGEEKLLVREEMTDIDFARNRRVEIKVEGMRDARILQRSIRKLQSDLFGRRPARKPTEDSQNAAPETGAPSSGRNEGQSEPSTGTDQSNGDTPSFAPAPAAPGTAPLPESQGETGL